MPRVESRPDYFGARTEAPRAMQQQKEFPKSQRLGRSDDDRVFDRCNQVKS